MPVNVKEITVPNLTSTNAVATTDIEKLNQPLCKEWKIAQISLFLSRVITPILEISANILTLHFEANSFKSMSETS